MINISFLSETEKEIVYRLLKYFKQIHHLTDVIRENPSLLKNDDLAKILNSGEI